MRYKIEELKDITDSREIMQSTPHGFSRYMMYIIIALLTVVITWSLLAKKEITAKANGVVRPSEEIYKVSSTTNGNVTSVNLKEGMEVKKGDILIVVDGEEYEIQQNVLQESLDKKEKELEASRKLKNSINDGANYLSQNDEIESSYYEKYELYKTTMAEYDKQGSATEAQLSNLKNKNEDLNLLLKSIDEEKNYFSSDHYMYYQYLDYEMTLNQHKDQIETYNKQIKELENSKTENSKTDEEEINNTETVNENIESNTTIDKQIETLKSNIKSSEEEINKYKNSQKATIKSNIKENEVSLSQGTVATNNNTYKEQYLTQLDTNISALEDSIQEIKMNLNLVISKLNTTSIKAEYDGVINIINEIKVGDYIQSGTQIASIVPDETSNFIAEIYIENQNIGGISEGEDVILEFASLPQSEYGVIRTNLDNISIDAKINQEQGLSYYTGRCKIDATSMKNDKGNMVDIKNGMIVQARIINREVSYFRYFLEMINILK